MNPSDIDPPDRYGVASVEWIMQRGGPRLGRILAAIACLAYVSISQAAPGTWKYSEGADRRSVEYTATVPLLGKATPVDLIFSCKLVATQCTKSDLDFEWFMHKTAAMKPFYFGAFEVDTMNFNRDNRLMQITITRNGQPDFVRKVRAGGIEPSEGVFIFHLNPNSVITEQNQKVQPSLVPEILQALAADGATSLNISVTDSKNAKLKLEVMVPLAAKQVEFRKLLKDLR